MAGQPRNKLIHVEGSIFVHVDLRQKEQNRRVAGEEMRDKRAQLMMWAQQSTAQWRSTSRLMPWRITVPYLREDLLQLTVVQLPGVPVQKLLQFSLGNSSIVVGINTVVCTTMQKRDEVKAYIKSIKRRQAEQV